MITINEKDSIILEKDVIYPGQYINSIVPNKYQSQKFTIFTDKKVMNLNLLIQDEASSYEIYEASSESKIILGSLIPSLSSILLLRDSLSLRLID